MKMDWRYRHPLFAGASSAPYLGKDHRKRVAGKREPRCEKLNGVAWKVIKPTPAQVVAASNLGKLLRVVHDKKEKAKERMKEKTKSTKDEGVEGRKEKKRKLTSGSADDGVSACKTVEHEIIVID
jgi:hypothetical protein